MSVESVGVSVQHDVRCSCMLSPSTQQHPGHAVDTSGCVMLHQVSFTSTCQLLMVLCCVQCWCAVPGAWFSVWCRSGSWRSRVVADGARGGQVLSCR